MDAETRMARKIAKQERKYAVRFKPKQTGRSVFTIQQIQAKRADQVKDGRATTKPSRSHLFA